VENRTKLLVDEVKVNSIDGKEILGDTQPCILILLIVSFHWLNRIGPDQF
jgi:hypothetical protein